MNIYDMAHGLARALRQHPDVLAMAEAKRKVDQDPHAKQMLDDFMEKSMQLQMPMEVSLFWQRITRILM